MFCISTFIVSLILLMIILLAYMCLPVWWGLLPNTSCMSHGVVLRGWGKVLSQEFSLPRIGFMGGVMCLEQYQSTLCKEIYRCLQKGCVGLSNSGLVCCLYVGWLGCLHTCWLVIFGPSQLFICRLASLSLWSACPLSFSFLALFVLLYTLSWSRDVFA